MERLLEFIIREWAAISAAPAAFILLLVIAGTVGFFVARWRYEGIIDQLKQRLETLGERLEAKDEQITEYRERLRLVPRDVHAHANLTSAELQRSALAVVAGIREFLKERSLSEGFAFDRVAWKESTPEERQRAWEEETRRSMEQSIAWNAEYDRKYRIDSILLRDELLARLPPEARHEREFRMYEHPTNAIGIGMVADDLERLAKSLPVTTSGVKRAVRER
jgi:hypothetical protein